MSASPAARARAAFRAAWGREPAGVAQAPGRINLIGEHTDYNDGFVLPCAIDRGTAVAHGPADDALLHVLAADLDAMDSFAPSLPIARAPAEWADYARGVASELLAAGRAIASSRLAIAGDVPPGAGLSSSAALEVAVALALGAGDMGRTDLARLCQRAENRFVGCQCGVMDQLASAAGVAGHALLIDCRSLALRPVLLPAHAALVVVDSGVRHSHASGGYNRRRAECERAAAHYRVAALRDLDEATLRADAAGLDADAFRRARHVVTENARVLAAAEALAAGDLRAMGTLMAASHRSMRDDFVITVPEIDRLVALADEVIAGGGGARMTGGGFGGSVVALVPDGLVDELVDHLARSFPFPRGASAHIRPLRAVAGAAELT